MVGTDETMVTLKECSVRRSITEIRPSYHLYCAGVLYHKRLAGVLAEVIMKWTGHSDYKSDEAHIKIVDKLKVAEMDEFGPSLTTLLVRNKSNPKRNPNVCGN